MSDENDKKDENDENNEPKFKLDKSDGGKEKEDNTPPEKILGKFETQEDICRAPAGALQISRTRKTDESKCASN